MKLITKLAVVCILCALFVCGGVSADSSPDSIHIKMGGNVGLCNVLGFGGYHIIDCDGNIKTGEFLPDFPDMWDLGRSKVKKISLSGLNCDKPFKEVKLYFTLGREWGFSNCHTRYDKFTLNVTDLLTENVNEYCVRLKVSHSYQVAKSDSVTIYDGNKNKLKYFSPTRKSGRYGNWEYPINCICIEMEGDIDWYNCLWYSGFCIIDGYGNHYYKLLPSKWYDYENAENWSYDGVSKIIKIIDLSDSGLNFKKPFKKVGLHLVLKRNWGFSYTKQRHDGFTLDVTDVVTKNGNEPYAVRLKVDNSYKVAKADSVTFYDGKGHKLKHFPPTRDDQGCYGGFEC